MTENQYPTLEVVWEYEDHFLFHNAGQSAAPGCRRGKNKEERTIHHTVIDRTKLLWSERVPNISAEVAMRLEVRTREDQKP